MDWGDYPLAGSGMTLAVLNDDANIRVYELHEQLRSHEYPHSALDTPRNTGNGEAHSARAILSPNTWHRVAQPGMAQDQLKHSPHLCKKSCPQSLPLYLVPRHSRLQFVLSCRINTEPFHLESSSFSMQRRTSDQSERCFAPLSMTAPSNQPVKCTKVVWSDL